MRNLLARSLRRIAIVFSVLSLLTACGGGSSSSSGSSNPPSGSNTPINLTASGKIVAPDGSTPLANALVYVENSSAPDAQASAATARRAAANLPCGTPPNPAWPATCTAADGSFSLAFKAPDGAKLVAQKGAFRAEQILAVSSGGVINAGNVAISTGASGSAKMAVVTGSFDSIEDILAKLGYGELEFGKLKLGTEKFKLYNGNPSGITNTLPSLTTLFEDTDGSGRADLFDYAIVFFNCGLEEDVVLTDANKALLRSYVNGGGRLYASDLAYDIVEQVFPEYIDFLGDENTPANTAEALDLAEQGNSSITVNATVDPALREWLRTVTCEGGACVQADNTVHIEGFLSGWAVINGPHIGVTSARTWANGPVTFGGNTAAEDKPLTVSFTVGSGRVTYTSYHNEAAIGDQLQPQQRILQYLVFEL